MSKQIRKLPVDIEFQYDKLIDMKEKELDSFIKECEINIERLRNSIVKNYEQAQPYLLQMRNEKAQLQKNIEKMEAAKTFLSMEKNGSLISNLDLIEIKKTVQDLDEIDETPQQPLVEEAKKTPQPTKFKSQLIANWSNKKPDTTPKLAVSRIKK
jgi:hypothetical protein